MGERAIVIMEHQATSSKNKCKRNVRVSYECRRQNNNHQPCDMKIYSRRRYLQLEAGDVPVEFATTTGSIIFNFIFAFNR